MSTRKVTAERAQAIILSHSRQFVEDTTWDEPGHVWDQRLEKLAKYLDNEIGTDISEKATADLRELITTLEELQSVDAGTHPDIELNRSGTVDNRNDLRDSIGQVLADNLNELLQVAAFRPIKEGTWVAA